MPPPPPMHPWPKGPEVNFLKAEESFLQKITLDHTSEEEGEGGGPGGGGGHATPVVVRHSKIAPGAGICAARRRARMSAGAKDMARAGTSPSGLRGHRLTHTYNWGRGVEKA